MNVNNGTRNKTHGGGRSVLDYSLVACFALVLLMGVVVLDAFEYIAVPGIGGSKGVVHAELEEHLDVDILSNEEVAELQKQVADAKKLLEEKKAEVEKLVNQVEEEIEEKEGKKPETSEEKKAEEEKKEAVVEAVVEKELGIDKFCGGCQYGSMPFTCDKRVQWLMDAYFLSEDVAKESILHKCHHARRRGLRA